LEVEGSTCSSTPPPSWRRRESRLQRLVSDATCADVDMQEVIDTDGFFVRHGRQRRTALLPVAPSPEVDVASHVIDDDERQRRRRSADRTDDNDGKVRSVVTVNSTGWAKKTRGHRLVAIILSKLNRFIKKTFTLEDSSANLQINGY